MRTNPKTKRKRTSRVKRDTPHADLYQQRKAKWEKAHEQALASKPEYLDGAEFVRALTRARDATGDPAFDDALKALHAYGLDQQFNRHADEREREIFGDTDDGYLVQVHYLLNPVRKLSDIERNPSKRPSVSDACAAVAVEFNVPGSTFASVVQRLRKAYAEKHWGETPLPSVTDGDLGYLIEVRATHAGVPNVDGSPLVGSTIVRATAYWRRLFRDGDVTVRLVKSPPKESQATNF